MYTSGLLVRMSSSWRGITPPRAGISASWQPAMLASSIMGVRPTAMHTVSASSTFAVPGTGWK